MVDDTRDMAVKASANIDFHIAACEKRYQEWNGRLDRLFGYIKDAHDQTNKQINAIADQVSTVQTTLAEARGAGKAAKLIGGGITAVVGAASGFLAGHLSK